MAKWESRPNLTDLCPDCRTRIGSSQEFNLSLPKMPLAMNVAWDSACFRMGMLFFSTEAIQAVIV